MHTHVYTSVSIIVPRAQAEELVSGEPTRPATLVHPHNTARKYYLDTVFGGGSLEGFLLTIPTITVAKECLNRAPFSGHADTS